MIKGRIMSAVGESVDEALIQNHRGCINAGAIILDKHGARLSDHEQRWRTQRALTGCGLECSFPHCVHKECDDDAWRDHYFADVQPRNFQEEVIGRRLNNDRNPKAYICHLMNTGAK